MQKFYQPNTERHQCVLSPDTKVIGNVQLSNNVEKEEIEVAKIDHTEK